jgi:phospholipid/cholesterol/gamma-HCH transport system substrate-binding protein
MLDKQSGAITGSVNNINSVTKNLADHNKEVAATLSNLEKTTNKLAASDINGTIGNLKTAIDNLNVLVKKAASDEGSLGKLINDKTLYNNLNNSLQNKIKNYNINFRSHCVYKNVQNTRFLVFSISAFE